MNESTDTSSFFSWHDCTHSSFWLGGFRFMSTISYYFFKYVCPKKVLPVLSILDSHANHISLRAINMSRNNFMATVTSYQQETTANGSGCVWILHIVFVPGVERALKIRDTQKDICIKGSLGADKVYFLKQQIMQ